MSELNLNKISALIAIVGLIFGIFKFIQIQEIEAAKPYLEKKLIWCEEAVETASSIANSESVNPLKIQRFWELYWGVMGMVEKDEITTAMIDFGKGLESGNNLKSKALAIAHACRQELASDWSPSWSR